MNNLFDSINRGKDSLLATAFKEGINRRFREYGEILECALDTKKNSIVLLVRLEGEPAILRAAIDGYEISMDGDGYRVRIASLTISKEWLNILAQQYVNGKTFSVPQRYRKIVGILRIFV